MRAATPVNARLPVLRVSGGCLARLFACLAYTKVCAGWDVCVPCASVSTSLRNAEGRAEPADAHAR